jgi:uncharacterized membrane protein HdeD (DUF308 family)
MRKVLSGAKRQLGAKAARPSGAAKKQRSVVLLVCGLVLMVFPYFISNTILVVAIGIALIVVPYFVRI